jgi:MFS family permease
LKEPTVSSARVRDERPNLRLHDEPSHTPPVRARAVLPPGLALWGAAITFTSLYLAAGALTPLLVVYREQWAFSPALLTVAFAVYAVGFLGALLTLGSLSDYLGRRPVLVVSLIVQAASSIIFLTASGIEWVIVGRVVQGIAQGAATAAFTAALVELAPAGRKRLGATLGSVGLTGGLGVGSLLAGVAIQFTDAANTIIFSSLTVTAVLGAILIVLSPETVTPVPGAARALIPRISFPPATRREFAAAAPVIAAIWMLAGLSGGLAPSMVRSVFHLDSGLLDGTAGFIAPAVAAVVGLVFARIAPRRAMSIGIYASLAGSVLIIGGAGAEALAVMFIGQALAGVGFGAAFTAALRLIFPLAKAHERAGVVSGIYAISYVAFGVPIVIAGQLTGPLGVVPTVTLYTVVTIVLALVSLIAQRRIRHGEGKVSSSTSAGRPDLT